MGKKEEAEELKKLEDEAYFELCQIIAEAMQVQDIELLNFRIASWKNKYKKLLDGAASPAFKKKIEFLLTQYYSSVTQYILSQIKFKEKKKIENQSKCLRELYSIIRDTNDLPLLEKKVKEWKSKYPVQSFLNMYQKKIASYTRQKNLQDNAFEQDKAFSELVDITKKNLTLDELKQELAKWEKEYSINNKYNIDDFVKHQSEVKRYVSDEYLISIAKDLNVESPQNVIENTTQNQSSNETLDNNECSSLPNQANAYNALLLISRKPNNTEEVFKWVYKNKSIKFDDKYKELILSATYLDYSPKYLNSLSIPDIDISNPSLSYETYKSIDEVKKYAIISYFNLLLPPERAVSNDFFNKYIESIYKNLNQKHKAIDTSACINESNANIKPVIQPDISEDIQDEILPKQEKIFPEMPHLDVEVPDEVVVETIHEAFSAVDSEPVCKAIEHKNSDDIVKLEEKTKEPIIDLKNEIINLDNILNESTLDAPEVIVSKCEVPEDTTPELAKTAITPALDEIEEKANTITASPTLEVKTKIEYNIPKQEPEITPELINSDETVNSQKESTAEITVSPEISEDDPISYDSIVAISPQFFTIINDYSKQVALVDQIDQTTSKYVSLAMPTLDKSNSRNID